MRSHGWDRDLPEHKQQELRKKYRCKDFDALYNFYVPGFNLRSTDLQAFLGLRAIDKLDEYSKIRNKNFQYYISKVNNIEEFDIRNSEDNFISNFAFPVIKSLRNQIVNELKKRNIEVRPLIAGDMSKKPFCRTEGFYPNSDIVNKWGFYIPNHQDLNEEDMDKIIEIINKF
jgi:CDP-6-deoxy-D-xylo-4-hexulose-3-dehydrase